MGVVFLTCRADGRGRGFLVFIVAAVSRLRAFLGLGVSAFLGVGTGNVEFVGGGVGVVLVRRFRAMVENFSWQKCEIFVFLYYLCNFAFEKELNLIIYN